MWGGLCRWCLRLIGQAKATAGLMNANAKLSTLGGGYFLTRQVGQAISLARTQSEVRKARYAHYLIDPQVAQSVVCSSSGGGCGGSTISTSAVISSNSIRAAVVVYSSGNRSGSSATLTDPRCWLAFCAASSVQQVAMALGDVQLAGKCRINEAYNYIWMGRYIEARRIIRTQVCSTVVPVQYYTVVQQQKEGVPKQFASVDRPVSLPVHFVSLSCFADVGAKTMSTSGYRAVSIALLSVLRLGPASTTVVDSPH